MLPFLISENIVVSAEISALHGLMIAAVTGAPERPTPGVCSHGENVGYFKLLILSALRDEWEVRALDILHLISFLFDHLFNGHPESLELHLLESDCCLLVLLLEALAAHTRPLTNDPLHYTVVLTINAVGFLSLVDVVQRSGRSGTTRSWAN